MPLLLLPVVPRIKGGLLAQAEAVQERAADQGEGVVEVGDLGGALWLSGDRGERLDCFPGLLHYLQVQLQWGLRVQAEQLMLTEQMAVLGSSVVEQAAQQRKGVAQGGARIVEFAIGPQQRR